MITVGQFTKRCNCRSAGECNHNLFSEIDALDKLVNSFAKEMKKKLKKKYLEGYTGWDNKEDEKLIKRKLKEHCLKKTDSENMVDIANLVAMLWNMNT